jgi:predicted nucleic acid-binding protein
VKVLVDTNIVLDFLLQREPFFQDAELLFQAIDAGEIVGYVTATTLTDIFYTHVGTPVVLKKHGKQSQKH